MNPVTKLTVVCMWECFQTGTGSNVPKFNGFVHGWWDQVLQEHIKIINYFVKIIAINNSFIFLTIFWLDTNKSWGAKKKQA